MHAPLLCTAALLALHLAAGAASAQPVSRFDAVVAASPADYATRRAELLRDARRARTLLERELRTGTDPSRRMLARALSRRLAAPGRAAGLDAWTMSPRTAVLHNPAFRAQAELAAAYQGEPALAFERLFAAEAVSSWEAQALGSVVAGGGADAFGALASLLPRHVALGETLLEMDPAAAEDVLLRTMGRLEDPEDAPTLIAALGRAAAGPQSANALAALRRTFSTSRDDDLRRAAAAALGQRRDRASVALLLDSLAEPDQTAGSGTRREVTLRALGSILGPADLYREILRRVADRDDRIRLGAAHALGHRAPDARADELLATLPRDAQVLATLAADRGAAVRVSALASLAWLAIRVDVRLHDAPRSPLPAVVRDRVLSAMTAADVETRTSALDALWRLAEARLVARDAVTRRAVERIAREDPIEGLRRFARDVLTSLNR